MQRLARLGAQARLDELRREETAIRSAFPELFGGRAKRGRRGRPPASANSGPARGQSAQADGQARGGRGRRRRRSMSPAMRKAVSERMKKYWADRRKGKSKSA
jgi:hypothetical protein